MEVDFFFPPLRKGNASDRCFNIFRRSFISKTTELEPPTPTTNIMLVTTCFKMDELSSSRNLEVEHQSWVG